MRSFIRPVIARQAELRSNFQQESAWRSVMVESALIFEDEVRRNEATAKQTTVILTPWRLALA